MNIRELLADSPLFERLPDAELEALAEAAETVELPAGTVLIDEGSASDALYVVVDGVLEATQRSAGQDVYLSTLGRGEVIGEISLLDGVPRSATVRATKDSHVVRIGQEAAGALLSNATALRWMLRSVTGRLRNSQAMLRQTEKMAALGTLSAGIAHELNNPAAAVRRAASQLAELLPRWREQAAALADWPAELRARVAQATPTGQPPTDPLRRSDLEQEMQTWLERHGAEQAWEIGPDLVAAGWEPSAVDELLAGDLGRTEAVASWLSVSTTVQRLVAELSEAAQRIAGIVGGVKEYSNLDRAPAQDVDVVRGLEATLTLFGHRLKSVSLVTDFAEDTGTVDGHPGELNQVWTNLIANGLDAMEDSGTLTVRTRRHDGGVVVEIADTGPGIPDEVRDRLFEPFFTTKPVGEGTGLGLHITYNIVAGLHGGTIELDSSDAGTTATVWLPGLPGRPEHPEPS